MPIMNEAPDQSQHKPGMKVHVCNSSTREVEAGDQKLQVLKKKVTGLGYIGSWRPACATYDPASRSKIINKTNNR